MRNAAAINGFVHVAIVYDEWTDDVETAFVRSLMTADLAHPTEAAPGKEEAT